MSQVFPSGGIAKKFKSVESADNTALSSTITVSATDFGVVYRLWVGIDPQSEGDLENLPAILEIKVTIGSNVFVIEVHPVITHAVGVEDSLRTVDLGPWFFDFGLDGFYSGVKGDDIVVAIGALGSNMKTRVNYIYSGD